MRFPIRPFDKVPHFDFMRLRAIWLWGSMSVMLLTFVLLGVIGLNYGIDFVGGKMIEAKLSTPISVAQVREVTDKAGFEGSVIQEYGAPDVFLIRLPGNIAATQTAEAENSVMAGLSAVAGGAEIRRVEFVGPQVGEELRMKGLLAMLVSIVAILIYIWARFELRFGLGAILALLHDVIFTIGIVALMRTEITLTTLAAILTLIGYSLNETVVIFDRIRENRSKYPNRPLREVINLSVNQTLGRTIMTGGSVFLVLWCLFLWGGEAVHDFSRILIIGVALGTYSSIFVSSSALLALEEWYQKMARDDAQSKPLETKPEAKKAEKPATKPAKKS